MNRTFRLSPRPAIAIAALTVFASGCLVVVEKDDDHRRDRHRHLYAEWSLDIIVYRAETVAATDRSVNVTFEEAGTFLARADCGDITGSFDVDDNDGFTVSGLNAHENCRGGDRTLDLFSRAMLDARAYEADESELRIRSSDDGVIGFSTP